MRLRSIYFCTVAAVLPFARAQKYQTVTVQYSDPRIVYQGSWVNDHEDRHRYSLTPFSSFSFEFQGTNVYWVATVDPCGAKGFVTVDDNEPITVDTSAGTLATSVPLDELSFPSAVIFAATGLDESTSHTLNVSYAGMGALGGQYLQISTLIYTPLPHFLQQNIENNLEPRSASESIPFWPTQGWGSWPIPDPTAIPPQPTNKSSSGLATDSTPVPSQPSQATNSVTATNSTSLLPHTTGGSPDPAVNSEFAHKKSWGPVIGGAVGGFAAVMLVVGILLHRRKRPLLPTVAPEQDERIVIPYAGSKSGPSYTVTSKESDFRSGTLRHTPPHASTPQPDPNLLLPSAPLPSLIPLPSPLRGPPYDVRSEFSEAPPRYE